MMTRKRYIELVGEVLGEPMQRLANHVSFPQYLQQVALELFMKPLHFQGLEAETRRRLLQIEETGITDP